MSYENARVGNKKPNMSVSKDSGCVGKPGKDENFSKHKVTPSLIPTGGEGVHGMPLFSAASKRSDG